MAAFAVPLTDIYLYEEPSSTTLDLKAVSSRLADVLGIRPKVRNEFALHHAGQNIEALATRIAGARVTDLARPAGGTEPPPPLVQVERRHLESPERPVRGVLYDGMRFQQILRDILPPDERTLTCVHVAFTSRLLGTFDDADRRYHARAVVLGLPSLVSTTGVVEGPAKPREFYTAKRAMRIEAADARYEALKEGFAGRFLDFDDPRLGRVVGGYALQSVFYQMTGEPFCDDRDCVLFNAHWQEELLHAHIESGTVCARHRAVAQTIRGGRKTRRR